MDMDVIDQKWLELFSTTIPLINISMYQKEHISAAIHFQMHNQIIGSF